VQFAEAALDADPRGFGDVEALRYDELEDALYVVTTAGQKVRIGADGVVELLVGPEIAGPEVIDLTTTGGTLTGPLSALEPGDDVTQKTSPSELQPEPLPDDSGRIEDDVELDRVERFRGEDGQWYFRGIARNGEIVYPSEGYEDKRGAGNAGRALARRFDVDLVDV